MSSEKALKEAAEQKQKDSNKENPVEDTSSFEDSQKLELTQDIVGLIEYFKGIQEFHNQPVSQPLHVDALASKFAAVYEKARRVIDWKEEHLIRRTAIERSLKRRLLSKLSGITFLTEVSPETIAEPFVLELIRSGHFANNSISESKIEVVRKTLTKYIHVLGYGLASDEVNPIDIKTKVQFYNWLLEVAACEFEEILDPPLEESGMINFMTKIISDRLKIVPEAKMKEDEIKLQTFIAVQKALFNLDSPIVTYNVIKYKYPEWINNWEENKSKFTKEILTIWRNIEEILSNSESSKFFNLCERYDAPYLVLADVMKNIMKKPSEMLDIVGDWSKLKKEVKKVYDRRVSTLKSRLQRSAIYSTLSMLLAGIVSLFLVEGPIAKLVHGEFRLWAMAVDLAIPAGLMFILVTMIRLPGKGNYDVLVNEIKKIVYEHPEQIIYEINLEKQRNVFRNIFFSFFYIIGSMISFGFVFYVFKIAKIPWTSLYIDTANIAVVVFMALIIKQRSMEVTMEENAKLSDFFVDMFSIPLANLGQWFSNKWKEYNFVSVFFTTVVDLPLVTLFELIEDWRSFLKDKKAGIH